MNDRWLDLGSKATFGSESSVKTMRAPGPFVTYAAIDKDVIARGADRSIDEG